MKTAWLSLLALGIGATIATACTITTTDGSNLGGSSGDSGGSTARGGAGSGGATTGSGGATAMGGATAATGGAASGGAASGGAASGGTGGAATVDPTVVCDGKVAYGTPLDNCTFEVPDNTFCHECLSSACCDAVKQCYATGPNNTGNACAYGGPDGASEFTCAEACIVRKAKAGGGDYTEMDVEDCGIACSTTKCNGFPGSATSEIIGCMTHMCEKECVLDPAKL